MNMEPAHLTPDEIHQASGAKRKRKQIDWFVNLGVPAVLGADGKVKVLRAAYQAKMMPGSVSRVRAKTEPRLDLLRKAG